MHTPQWFLAEIVRPTVEEFDANWASVRHGMLAALVVSSLADHICVAQCPPDINDAALRDALGGFRKALRKDNIAFALVQDVADATKHKRIDRKGAHLKDVSGVRLEVVPVMTRGGDVIMTRAGQTLETHEQVEVVADDGRRWPLRDLILDALALLEEKLPG